jgi:hypothetical protein
MGILEIVLIGLIAGAVITWLIGLAIAIQNMHIVKRINRRCGKDW